MKKLNGTLKIIFLLLVLLIVALIAFVATFDANNYKPQIIEQVETATGRTFSIDGDIELSLFPWIGLKIENTWLGNAKGFHAEKFAAIKQLDVKVNVLPLLKKEIEINTIRLNGLNVSLEVAKDKSNNWSDLTQSKADASEVTNADDASEKSTASEPVSADAGLPLQSLKVEGFEFVDAVIVYEDKSTDTKATVSKFNLQTSAISFEEAIDVIFSARVENNNPVIDTRLNLTTQLIFNKDFTAFSLNDLVLTVFIVANEFIKQDEELMLKSSIDISMDEKRVKMKKVQLSALGTTTRANVVATNFLTTPLIQGDIEVEAFNAKDVAKRVGVALPEMAKSDALNNVAIKTKIKQQGDLLELNDLSLALDGNTLSGWLHVISIAKQKLRYDFNFDQLNVNDYLPPIVDEPELKPEPEPEPEQVEGVNSRVEKQAAVSTGDEKIELPLEMLRQLDVQGSFRIAALMIKEYDIKQFLVTTKAEKGKINIAPLSMQVLQGQVSSSLNMNVTQVIPTYDINLDVQQLQMGPVVNPFLEGVIADGKSLTMKGAANLKAAIKTSGETVNQLKKSSLGQIVLDMKQTEVNGFDPEYFMRLSIASYLDNNGFGLSKTITGSYKPREVTVFDTIHSTVALAKGIADTQDFLMDSKRVQVGAKGYADIVKNSLDVMSFVKLARSKTTLEKVLDQPIFVRVHGPFDGLKYDLDKNRLKESTTDVLKNEAKAKLDAEKQRLKAKADAEKQRLKAKVDEEKRRAEEKVNQKLKENTQKYEDKLKDKLKGLF